MILPPGARDVVAAAATELADRQFAVGVRRQLLETGLTDAQIDRCLSTGRWRRVGGGVIVMHNGPLTTVQEWAVAVLAGGKLAALAGRSAAQAGGLEGWPQRCTAVVVPRGTTYSPLEGVLVKVHESRRFTAADIQPGSWPPRVRIERGLIDAATWSPRPRVACGILAAGVQQRLTTSDRLLATLEQAGAIRYRRLLRSALIDIGGGAAAVSEIDFVRFCKRHGLPRPQLQQVRRDADGRRRYLDATLVSPTGVTVRVEIDGALHLVVSTYWDDMSRGNELAISRETALRFPSALIYLDDARIADQLRRALHLSGPSAPSVTRAS